MNTATARRSTFATVLTLAWIATTSVAAAEPGACVLVATSESTELVAVDIDRMSVANRIATIGNPVALAVSEDGLTTYIGLRTGEVMSLDSISRTPSIIFKADDDLTDMALTPDNRFIVTVSAMSRTLTLFEVANQQVWTQDVSCATGRCVPSAVAITHDSRFALVANYYYTQDYPEPVVMRVDLRELVLFSPGSPCQGCCKRFCCDYEVMNAAQDIVVVDNSTALVTINNALGLFVDIATGMGIRPLYESEASCIPGGTYFNSVAATIAASGQIYLTGLWNRQYNSQDQLINPGIKGVVVIDRNRASVFDLGFIGSSVGLVDSRIVVGDPAGGLVVINPASGSPTGMVIGKRPIAVSAVDAAACKFDTSTPTAVLEHTATPSPGVAFSPTTLVRVCSGDCSGDGRVTIDELVTGVNIALGIASINLCSSLDVNGDGRIAIHEIVAGTRNAVRGCGSSTEPN